MLFLKHKLRSIEGTQHASKIYTSSASKFIALLFRTDYIFAF